MHYMHPSHASVLQIDDIDISSLRQRPISLPQSYVERPRFHLTEETSLLHAGPDSNDIQSLVGLTSALLHRSEEFGQLEDVESTIKHLRSLFDKPLEDFNVSREAVTTSLVEMLAARVKGKADYASGDVDEIMTLCRGLLTPETSPSYVISAFQALTRAVIDEFARSRQIDLLDEAVTCLREAVKVYPSDLHENILNLANLLAIRFLTSDVNDDYEEATQVLQKIIVSSPGNRSGSYHIGASSLATALRHARAMLYANPEDVKEGIFRCRSFLDHASLFGDPLHPVVTELLERHTNRHEYLGSSQRPPEARSEIGYLTPSVQLGPIGVGVDESNVDQLVPPLTVVEENIKDLRHCLSTARQGTDGRRDLLKDLVRWYKIKIHWTKNMGDISEAIKVYEMLLDSTHPSDHSRFFYLSSFATLLVQAYKQSDRTEYLDDSIALHRQVLEQEGTQLIHFVTIQWLIGSLTIRCRLFGHKRDLDEIMDRFKSGVTDTYATVPSRFELACQWAYSARISRHNSLPTAYQSAMSLMQESLVFAPTLSIQHDRLVEKRNLYEKTPLNFASHQIRVDQVEQAIETLEQGRALLWSEMQGLRTSTDRLRMMDHVLADRFTAINRELELLTTSASSSVNVQLGLDHIEAQSHDNMERLHLLVAKQQGMLKERDALISQIRGLPGFENFLMPLSFDILRSAASHGPVIIINHSKWRSDIIIVLHNSPPSLITTSYKFFDRANELKDRLMGMRKDSGPDSQHYQRVLSSVLVDLYELVGRPVIRRLNELGISEQSRIWWCPTSVFGYLPLHAMGPVSSDVGLIRYFSDLYISSYTPSFSALIASRKPDPQTPILPTLLLVAQPSPSLPGIWEEIQVIRALNVQSKCLISHRATPSTVLDGLRHHRFCHFACHGVLTTGKPFDAALVLHDRETLTLLDITRSRLPDAEFAFLASCHTAELSDGSIPDEVLHLAAAMHYSGFRSVIGAMWAMVDEDGRDLAKYFYKSMFSDEGQGMPYYERSARALVYAVRQLRRKGVGLERWVNYVHYGA